MTLKDPDAKPADQVDEHNRQSRDRVAADEFTRAVHRAEEIRLFAELGARYFRFFFCDIARV